jgi:protein-S-isoprenylcysteine O-methyltransferase Ste14
MTAYVWPRPSGEERDVIATLGNAYEGYARKTKRFISFVV